MSIDSRKARSIFLAAVENHSPDQWGEFLDEACGENAELRRRIELLLEAHQGEDSYLDRGDQLEPDATLGQHLPDSGEKGGEEHGPERPSSASFSEDQIGPYKLLQPIGEGGMGVVYMAEQQQPVKRRVALKIIKPGMDTREVVARFEAERQALAMMDHPNIAQVLDAGTTDEKGVEGKGVGSHLCEAPAGPSRQMTPDPFFSDAGPSRKMTPDPFSAGRPYFVMELVRGIPITEYCDKEQLTTRQRISLLTDVCHAIQHAHQKGVIHRDIKPSNVLITLQDGKPIVKVIDFGVAKAINQQLTEKTLFTAFGQMVGTPQYMSPEQAEMSGLDIDTRSDIYSIGVLMYELMTGTTPLDGKRLRSLGYAEMQRIIREEEPPRPSNRVSTMGEKSTSVAKHRSVNAKRLHDQLAGELDWIVMKALEKDRGRRYETANALASDIERYLRNDPVEACPPSAAYRLRKFVARNKAIAGTVAAITLLLLAVIAINTTLAAWANRSEGLSEERRGRELQLRTKATRSREEAAKQRQQAERERDKAQAAEAQAAAQREVAQAADQRAQTNFQQARSAVDQYLQTVSESELLVRPGMSPLRRQLLDSARTFYQTFLDQQTTGDAPQRDTATARYGLGRILEEQGDRASARTEYQAVRSEYQQLVTDQPDDHPLRLELVDICRRLEDWKAAEQQCKIVLDKVPDHAAARRSLAATHEAAARHAGSRREWDETIRRYAEAEQSRMELTSGDEPSAARRSAGLAETHYATALVLLQQEQPAASLAKSRSGIATAERARDLDPRTPRFGQLVAAGMLHRARTERAMQQTDEGLRSYQHAESAWSRMVFEFPSYAEFKAELARTRQELADYQRTLGSTQDADQTDYRLDQFLSQQPRSLPGDHYQLAVIYAQLAQPAADDASQRLSESALATLPGFAEKAVEHLALAVKQGYRDALGLDQDPLLASLAERDDFQVVLVESQQETALGGPSALSSDLPHRLLMIASLRGIAAAHRELGQLKAAQATLDQCLAELDKLPSGDENAPVAERGKTIYALGHLHWASRRYREAHQVWNRGFGLLEQAHDQADEDKSELAHAIATQEWQLAIVFGEIAFWGEAARHRENYIRFSPYMDAQKESQVALVTLVADGGERYEDACRYLLSRFAADDSPTLLGMLAQGKQAVIPPKELVEFAKRENSLPASGDWARCVLGVCQLRNGDTKEAALNLWFSRTFLRAQAIYGTGDHAAAKFWLDIGERLYASCSRDWLGKYDPKSPDAGFWNWWEQAVQQASRQAAWQLIEQRSAPDPWACLFEARGYGLIGDGTKSEAAFAEALTPPPDNPQVWLAAAETRALLGQHDEAEALFAKALELAPEDPEAWIARGKYYLELGLDAEADADMMRAADWSKDDLDIFIRSGWWAVGPYPQDVKKSFPPEDSPHPSQPLAVDGDDPLKKVAPRRWVRIPVDSGAQANAHGKLVSRVRYDGHLTNYAKNVSVYMLAYVYSPDDRTATLCIGGGYMWSENSLERQAQMRIRLNGETVFDWAQCPYSHVALQRLPVHLTAGRNEVLVRISSPTGHNFRLRLGDSPISQALLAARSGQWHRAAEAFHRIPSTELVQGGYSLATIYCASLAAAEDAPRYEQAVTKASAYGANTNENGTLATVLNAMALRPNLTMTGDALLGIIEKFEESTKPSVTRYKGRAFLRAHEFQQAINWLSRNKLTDVESLCIRAMAHHELGRETEAKESLQKAKDNVLSQMAERRPPSYHGHALLVEAHQRITGIPLAEDPAWVSLREEIDSQLAKMPPETEDFDLALMLEPKQPNLWVSRARRLAELERWEDAERDFAEALRLDKNNADTWLASARYWTERENLEKARDAYDQVLRLDQDSTYRQQALNDLKGNNDLFLGLLDARGDDGALWQARAAQLCEEKRWADAVQVWQHRVEQEPSSPGLTYQLALLQLAASDMNGYASTCGRSIDRYAKEEISSTSELAAWACILSPAAFDDYAPVVELAKRCCDRFPVGASHRVTLGAALMRAGRNSEAIAELEEGALLAAGNEDSNASPPAYAWYLLAIANSQMGNRIAARKWHEKAQRWTREQIEAQTPSVTRWNRKLTLELLENESAALAERAAEPIPRSG